MKTLKSFTTIFALLFVATVFMVNGQGHSVLNDYKKNTLLVNIGGNGLTLYAISYDRIIFKRNKLKLAVNLGVSFVPFIYWGRYNTITLPYEFCILIGKSKHNLELGYGQNLYFNISTGESYGYNKNFISLYNSLKIGYRLQKPQGGFFFSSALYLLANYTININRPNTDLLGNTDNTPYPYVFYPWLGFGFGYTF